MGRPRKAVPASEEPAVTPPASSVDAVKPETDPTPPAASEPAKEIPASDIGSLLVAGMPEMQPGETRAAIAGEPFALEPGDPPADAPKKRGRPPGKKSAKDKAKEAAGAAAVVAHDPAIPDKYDAAAEMYVDGAIFASTQFISNEWAPRSPQEPAQIKKSLAQFMRMKQVDEPPVWVVLLGSIALYAGPRLIMPETKAKIARLFGREPEPAKKDGETKSEEQK